MKREIKFKTNCVIWPIKFYFRYLFTLVVRCFNDKQTIPS